MTGLAVKVAFFLLGALCMFVAVMLYACCVVAGRSDELNRMPTKEEWKAGKRQSPWL